MKVVYFDCFSGISGDMLLASLIDAGVKPSVLGAELKKLDLPSFSLDVRTVKKHAIGAKSFAVKSSYTKKFAIPAIQRIIKKSSLSTFVKTQALCVFERIMIAEEKVHRTKKRNVHIHELGELDTIIDVVGAFIAIEALGIERVYSSCLALGKGMVQTAHGALPIPAPATAELLKKVPCYGKDVAAELVTPTGAALIGTLASSFGDMPCMKISRIGYGAGERTLPFPNALRAVIGTLVQGYDHDEAVLIETNIDDMNPQLYEYTMEKLFDQGALDVWFSPIQMKKNRPAVILSVLCSGYNVDALCDVLLSETTSIGVRIQHMQRKKLRRREKKITTAYGAIGVKIAYINNQIKHISPNYEDCKRRARKNNIPCKRVYDEAKFRAQSLLGKKSF